MTQSFTLDEVKEMVGKETTQSPGSKPLILEHLESIS
jgi:hypothetical protein